MAARFRGSAVALHPRPLGVDGTRNTAYLHNVAVGCLEVVQHLADVWLIAVVDTTARLLVSTVNTDNR